CEGIHPDEDPDGLVECGAGEGIAAVFGGPRWVCVGGRCVDVCARGDGACAGARGPDSGGGCGVWVNVRSVSSGAAERVRRGTRAGDWIGDAAGGDWAFECGLCEFTWDFDAAE